MLKINICAVYHGQSFRTNRGVQRMLSLARDTPATNGFTLHRLSCEQRPCVMCQVLPFVCFFK